MSKQTGSASGGAMPASGHTADHLDAAPLEGEGNTARTASDVQHSAAQQSQRLALGGRPVSRRGQIDLGTRTALGEAVFSFDDFGNHPALRPVEQRPTEDVVHAVSSA